MKLAGGISSLIGTCCLLASTALTQSRPSAPITLTVNTTSHGHAIPIDFSGLGFETASELPNYYGVSGYFFTPSNTQAITLLQNIGVKEPQTSVLRNREVDLGQLKFDTTQLMH